MQLRRTVLNRRQTKSSEGEFIWELENSYELSPKLSELILNTAKECLLRDHTLKEGQIEVTVFVSLWLNRDRRESRKNDREDAEEESPADDR